MPEILQYNEIPKYATILLFFLLIQQGIQLAEQESSLQKQHRATTEHLLDSLLQERQPITASVATTGPTLAALWTEIRSEGEDPAEDSLRQEKKYLFDVWSCELDSLESRICSLEKELDK